MWPSILLLLGSAPCPPQEVLPDELRCFPSSTAKVQQLTGDFDRARGLPTLSRTASSAQLVATDLGSSFEHRGRLYFLFGDSVGRSPHDDVLAWSDAHRPEELVLRFFTNAEGVFEPLRVPDVGHGAFEVPSHGISLDERIFVVFTDDHSDQAVMGRSVLAASADDGRSFAQLYELSRSRFVNVALARETRRGRAGYPNEDNVLLWGSGRYRASNVRLACSPAEQFSEKPALRFFRGLEGGQPAWSTSEAEGVDLFHHPVVGELSVAWIEQLQRWVMLYNSSAPRGIVMRSAREPWGPWSAPQVLFDPWADCAYGTFLHVDWLADRMDGFHDPGEERKWGAEYGPYLIPRFTSGDSQRCTLYFSMSTWNPYQVVLMKTELGYPARLPAPRWEQRRWLPGSEDWTTMGTLPARFERNGRPHVLTFVNGDADQCVSHFAFEPKTEASLEFSVHGGCARLLLVRESKAPPSKIEDFAAFQSELEAGAYGPVLESISGPSNNACDVAVRWNLHAQAGQRLRLYLIDSLTKAWGFLALSEITLRER